VWRPGYEPSTSETVASRAVISTLYANCMHLCTELNLGTTKHRAFRSWPIVFASQEFLSSKTSHPVLHEMKCFNACHFEYVRSCSRHAVYMMRRDASAVQGVSVVSCQEICHPSCFRPFYTAVHAGYANWRIDWLAPRALLAVGCDQTAAITVFWDVTPCRLCIYVVFRENSE
jgi:hypothetical protein